MILPNYFRFLFQVPSSSLRFFQNLDSSRWNLLKFFRVLPILFDSFLSFPILCYTCPQIFSDFFRLIQIPWNSLRFIPIPSDPFWFFLFFPIFFMFVQFFLNSFRFPSDCFIFFVILLWNSFWFSLFKNTVRNPKDFFSFFRFFQILSDPFNLFQILPDFSIFSASDSFLMSPIPSESANFF